MITPFDIASAGVSTIPVGPPYIGKDGKQKSKTPYGPRLPRNEEDEPTWDPYQAQIADNGTLHRWFDDGKCAPAVVHGKISGNRELIDFDGPKDDDQEPADAAEKRAKAWAALMRERGHDELMDALVIVQTPAGFHFIYRCDEEPIPGNQHLAKRPGRKSALIETRGEGGYALCPSAVIVHPSGKPYILVQGDFLSPPIITSAQRQALLDCAREFDETPKKEQAPPPELKEAKPSGDCITRFNQDHDWFDSVLLGSLGLSKVSSNGTETRYQNAAGKQLCIYANGMTVYSGTLARDLSVELETKYSKFDLYMHKNYGGDKQAAIAGIKAMGYGTKRDNNQSAADTEPWPDPQPIKDELLPVPPLEREMLPKAFREYVFDTAERIGCPPDFVAVALIAVTGAVIGTACAIRPKRFDSWAEVPNLWGAGVSEPGRFKTPSLNEPLRFLRPIEERWKEEHEAEMQKYVAEKAAYDAREKAIKKAMEKLAEEEI